MGVSCEPRFLVKGIFVLFLRGFRWFSLITPPFRCPFVQPLLPHPPFSAKPCAPRTSLPYRLWSLFGATLCRPTLTAEVLANDQLFARFKKISCGSATGRGI